MAQPASTELTEAVDINLRGFAHKRSRTHPFPVERLNESLWVAMDAPRKPGKTYRNREYFALHANAKRTDQSVRDHAGDSAHLLCICHAALERDPEVESAYKALGWKLSANEGLFVFDLTKSIDASSNHDIRRITSVEQSEQLKSVARTRQLTDAEAIDPDAAHATHAAYERGKPIGWSSTYLVNPTLACTLDVKVLASHRRRGVGRALMGAILRHDAARGVHRNHLIASGVGGKLYTSVGFTRIGTLTMFHRVA